MNCPLLILRVDPLHQDRMGGHRVSTQPIIHIHMLVGECRQCCLIDIRFIVLRPLSCLIQSAIVFSVIVRAIKHHQTRPALAGQFGICVPRVNQQNSHQKLSPSKSNRNYTLLSWIMCDCFVEGSLAGARVNFLVVIVIIVTR